LEPRLRQSNLERSFEQRPFVKKFSKVARRVTTISNEIGRKLEKYIFLFRLCGCCVIQEKFLAANAKPPKF
jgi:hypothetical protein